MKIGYPCINRTIGCTADRTFRLKSYSDSRLVETVENNLSCLLKILKFNVENAILFFRITSDLVPFASHPINWIDWASHFKEELREIGGFIKANNVRISMHPDQFNVLNSPDENVFERTVAELSYHAQVLDTMNLGEDAKIQLHVGGVYGDKARSMDRYVSRVGQLPKAVRQRLVIENDDRLYTLQDCVSLSSEVGIPVIFDTFHHQLNGSGEGVQEAMVLVGPTWKSVDGIPMVDYSSQSAGQRRGHHAESLDSSDFQQFLHQTSPHDFDIMLEIKDKEASALKAIETLIPDDRFYKPP